MHLFVCRFFICLHLLLPIHSFSQQLVWSDAARNERAIEHVQAVAQIDTVLHIIEEREDHNLRHVRYGWNSMRVLHSTDIQPTDNDTKPEYFYILGDTLHILSTRWNRTEDCTEVLASSYDSEGKMVGAEVLVHKRFEPGEPRKSGLQCTVSPNDSLLLLYFDSENERKQSEGIHFKCYRPDWKMVWEKDLRLPPAGDILQVHHFLLDNEGCVYMMSGRKPLKTSSDWQRPQGGQYVVYYYNYKLNKLKQYDISLKDKQVISVDFVMNKKQDVLIAGYYSDNFQNKAAGTLLFTIGNHGGIIQTASYTPFSRDFMKEMTGKEKGTPEYFYLDHLHVSAAGTIVLAGEQYYTSRYISTDPTTGRQMVEYRYNFDDIMLCMMDSSARHLHTLRIPKRQFTSDTNDPNFSYAFTADDEHISITFNDDEENNLSEPSKKWQETALWSGSKVSVTTRVQLSYDGSWTRRTLVDNNNERLLFNPLMQPIDPWASDVLGFDDKRSYKFCRIR